MTAVAPPAPNPLLLDLPDELLGPRVLARRYRTNSAAAADGQQGLTAAERARLSDILSDGER